jgi:hypothetical protein
MSLLANLKRTANIEAATDYPLNARPKMSTGLHNMTVEMAYLGESSGGSISVTLKLVEATGATLDTTLYITSGREKGQKHYFIDKQTGAQKYLPSFTIANDLSRLTADQELFELEPEEKTVMVYNYDLRKDVPTTKQVLTELIGKEITVGVVGVLKDQFKDPTKFYTSFEIDKVFHTETGCTVVELESGLTEGVYIKSWAERNTPTEDSSTLGIRDKRELSKAGAENAVSISKPSSTAATPFSGGTPISSKFGKKV